MNIRAIQAQDNPQVAAVIRQVFLTDGYPQTGTAFADLQLDHMFETYSQPRSGYFVIEDRQAVVGGAGIGPVQDHPDTCELQKMYFLQQARGKGMGKKLLAKCLRLAKEMGYQYCYLETLAEMQQAQHLYKNAGFEPLEQPMGNTGHTTCGLWMIKKL